MTLDRPELQILLSYCNAEEALEMYKLRWQVETMFKGMKSGGFDIEGSYVRDLSRMSNLFAVCIEPVEIGGSTNVPCTPAKTPMVCLKRLIKERIGRAHPL